ncbi:MAG: apolipoprotein N-acyltransferase [Gammaproteobacteria bacterium]|nr:apolipoprotein N-acyltransferase [Gammaproteobacteria bacterium]
MNPDSGSQRRPAWPARLPVVADGVATLAGASLVLAFAPFAWRPLAVLSPALLLWLWLHSSPSRALWRGYLFGLGFFGCGVSWVFNSIHVFGEAPAALAALITASLVLFISLYPALTGYLVNRYIKAPPAISLLLAYPAIWTLGEWTRGWLFTGFPWLTIGQAQLDWPLAGVVPLLGATGAGWICMLTAGALVYVFIARGCRRWLAVAGIACLWVMAAWFGTLSWTAPQGEALTLTLVQGNIAQDDKMSADSRQPTLKLYRRLTRAHWDSDLIVWPETAVPTWYDQVADSFIEPLAREARRHDAALVTGVFVFDPRTGNAYNAVARLGEPPEFYFKRHLVPFGEYMPLRGWLQWMEGMLVIPMSDLSSGDGRPLLRLPHLDNLAVGISICYEAAYGTEVNDALPQAALLINVSNDAWFGDSLAPHQHLEIARLRAVETGRALLRATNTGISAIIDAQGEITARSPQFETRVLSGAAQPRSGMTPFSRWENWPVITLSLLSVLATLVLLRTRQDNARTNIS